MKKKHSIGRFIVLSVLCVVFLALTVFSFSLPAEYADYDFVGFARAINLGIEYKGGTSFSYSVKNNSLDNANMDAAISNNANRINYLLQNNAYYESNVYVNGNGLVVEIYNDYKTEDVKDLINLKPYFAIKTSADGEEVLTAKDVANAYATSYNGQNVYMVAFTTEGAEKFSQVISSKTAYFFIGSQELAGIDVSTAQKEFVGLTTSSAEMAEYYASETMSSKYDVSFEETATRVYTDADATKNCITAICLTVGIFAVCALILSLVFKKLGLVGSLILLMSVLAQIILLQSVPVFVLTGPSLFASLLCMIVGALTIYLIFNKMHLEYKMGKILPASVKFGYNKIWRNILDMYVIMLIPSIITYFFGSYLVKHFAMALICGFGVYFVFTLVLTKFFSIWLTNITYKNKDYGFKREAHVDELK